MRLYVLYRFLVVALAYVFMLMQFVRKCGSVSSAKSLVWLLTPLPYKENGNKDKRKRQGTKHIEHRLWNINYIA
ncbi:hypothetical protein [Helicobacter labetoulli]|uniref:hypothetical protein n=2 Tax=Helicobacter labetoulli TaxID=2315333 RepID=UPI000EF73491|nr:hypothetical protein [Helicobacter labetoulli]